MSHTSKRKNEAHLDSALDRKEVLSMGPCGGQAVTGTEQQVFLDSQAGMHNVILHTVAMTDKFEALKRSQVNQSKHLTWLKQILLMFSERCIRFAGDMPAGQSLIFFCSAPDDLDAH